MSYEKVKAIKIKENKVFINCASNNVRPLHYTLEEYPSLTKILQEQGLNAVEIELLKNYEEGNLQDGKNKFTRALKVLKFLFKEEYKNFDWRENPFKYGSEEDKQHRLLRESEEFKALLLKALNTKLPKEKYVLTKEYEGKKAYLKSCRNSASWTYDRERAKVFDFKAECENVKGYYPSGINWIAEELNEIKQEVTIWKQNR